MSEISHGNILFLSDVPQLILQVWYMYQLNNIANNIIAISSAVFSAVSIVVAVLSMSMARSLVNSQESTSIKVDITGKPVAAKLRGCAKRVRGIRKGLSLMIGLDAQLIEVLKPSLIPNGIQLVIHLYVSNKESRKQEFAQVFTDAKNSGRLQEMIRAAWKLKGVPLIAKLKCEYVESRNEIVRKRTATILDPKEMFPQIEFGDVPTLPTMADDKSPSAIMTANTLSPQSVRRPSMFDYADDQMIS